MSSLTDIDKRYLLKILESDPGYVLDFTDPSYAEFFHSHGVDIHGHKYHKYGTSKLKKLRAFWEIESDQLVGKVLDEMLNIYRAECDLSDKSLDQSLLRSCREIVAKLRGRSIANEGASTPEIFLTKEFEMPSLESLPIESALMPIIEGRIAEAKRALQAKAYLSVIFLCGSVLEALLLGVAKNQPAAFNQASARAKDSEGKVKKFPEWSLAQLIDTAGEVGVLKPDVKKFSHGLRDFRNYIHPYCQMISRFSPDEHTAKLCFQVLKAAMANVAGERD